MSRKKWRSPPEVCEVYTFEKITHTAILMFFPHSFFVDLFSFFSSAQNQALRLISLSSTYLRFIFVYLFFAIRPILNLWSYSSIYCLVRSRRRNCVSTILASFFSINMWLTVTSVRVTFSSLERPFKCVSSVKHVCFFFSNPLLMSWQADDLRCR